MVSKSCCRVGGSVSFKLTALGSTRTLERSCSKCCTVSEGALKPACGNTSSDAQGEQGLQLVCSFITSVQSREISWCYQARTEFELQSAGNVSSLAAWTSLFSVRRTDLMSVWAVKMGATVELGSFTCKTMWEMIISIFFGCFNL